MGGRWPKLRLGLQSNLRFVAGHTQPAPIALAGHIPERLPPKAMRGGSEGRHPAAVIYAGWYSVALPKLNTGSRAMGFNDETGEANLSPLLNFY